MSTNRQNPNAEDHRPLIKRTRTESDSKIKIHRRRAEDQPNSQSNLEKVLLFCTVLVVLLLIMIWDMRQMHMMSKIIHDDHTGHWVDMDPTLLPEWYGPLDLCMLKEDQAGVDIMEFRHDNCSKLSGLTSYVTNRLYCNVGSSIGTKPCYGPLNTRTFFSKNLRDPVLGDPHSNKLRTAMRILASLRKPIVFVGDGLSRQNQDALICEMMRTDKVSVTGHYSDTSANYTIKWRKSDLTLNVIYFKLSTIHERIPVAKKLNFRILTEEGEGNGKQVLKQKQQNYQNNMHNQLRDDIRTQRKAPHQIAHKKLHPLPTQQVTALTEASPLFTGKPMKQQAGSQRRNRPANAPSTPNNHDEPIYMTNSPKAPKRDMQGMRRANKAAGAGADAGGGAASSGVGSVGGSRVHRAAARSIEERPMIVATSSSAVSSGKTKAKAAAKSAAKAAAKSDGEKSKPSYIQTGRSGSGNGGVNGTQVRNAPPRTGSSTTVNTTEPTSKKSGAVPRTGSGSGGTSSTSSSSSDGKNLRVSDATNKNSDSDNGKTSSNSGSSSNSNGSTSIDNNSGNSSSPSNTSTSTFPPVDEFKNKTASKNKGMLTFEKIKKYVGKIVDEQNGVVLVGNIGVYYNSREQFRSDLPELLSWMNTLSRDANSTVFYRETAAQHWNHTQSGYYDRDYDERPFNNGSCVPVADSTPEMDWRNTDVRHLIENDGYRHIRIIPFKDITQPLFNMHPSGEEEQDCTNFCFFPQMWQSIWYEIYKGAVSISPETEAILADYGRL